MQDTQRVIAHILQAFHDTEHPGDAFVQGSHEGCEPGESVASFIAVTDCLQLDPVVLDGSYDALSFFSEGGFWYFLPAYVIADPKDQLHTADPVFHLTNGFIDKAVKIPAGQRIYVKTIGKSAFINPRRYGAMTWHDHAHCRLSVFTRGGSASHRGLSGMQTGCGSHDLNTEAIKAALDCFWRDRAANGSTYQAIRQYRNEDAEYLRDIARGKNE